MMDDSRERHEASLYDDGDDERLDPRDFQDEEPPRYRTPYRCVRGDCGALDCSRCHPGSCDDGEPNE